MGATSASDGPAGQSATVVVPATTANLGCAFDCAGIALNLYLRARVTITASPGLKVSYRGADAGKVPLDESNVALEAMRHAAARPGGSLPFAARGSAPGLELDLHNEIPIGVGLGSSAAAILAGTVLGTVLSGLPLDAAALLRLTLEIESHPDNLAAAIYGGMVLAAVAPEAPGPSGVRVAATSLSPGVRIARTPVSEDLDFVAVIPDTPLPTAESRAVLPESYSRKDVVANLQHTALLAAAFFSGGPLSPELFADRLHQPYRSALVPGIANCLAYRHEALAGIFLSGAGSAVMAIVDSRRAAGAAGIKDPIKEKIASDLVAEFQKQGTAARALFLKADNSGTRISSPAGERLLASPLQSSA